MGWDVYATPEGNLKFLLACRYSRDIFTTSVFFPAFCALYAGCCPGWPGPNAAFKVGHRPAHRTTAPMAPAAPPRHVESTSRPLSAAASQSQVSRVTSATWCGRCRIKSIKSWKGTYATDVQNCQSSMISMRLSWYGVLRQSNSLRQDTRIDWV